MKNLQVVEKDNQKVITTKELAEMYETDAKIITKNFNRNKERYVEGKHYFLLNREEIQDLISKRQIDVSLLKVSKLYLWTEKGALLHAKSLNTDRAWEAYEYLIDFYFRVQEEKNELETKAIKKIETPVKSLDCEDVMEDILIISNIMHTILGSRKDLNNCRGTLSIVEKMLIDARERIYTTSNHS